MTTPFALPNQRDLRTMLGLAVPVVVVQVGMMLMGVADTIVVGWVSAEALAAVALGNLAVMALSAFGMGTLMAMEPLVAQAIGADDQPAVRRAVQRGLLLSLAITVPTVLILVPAEPVLILLRQPPETVSIATDYILRRLPGLFPFFAFMVLRLTLQAMERMRPIVLTIVFANLVNVVLDLVMVHGHLGCPALGANGSAWATTISRCLLFLGLALASRRDLAAHLRPLDREAFRLAPLWRTALLGMPIGLQLQLEFAAFGVIALLMGGLGTVQMAAHQVAINLASLTFMVPLGVSAAAAVHVGHAVGRGDGPGMRRSASAALVAGGGFMALAAMLFLGLPETLSSAYTSDLDVRFLAATLIPVAGMFQIVDGLQVVSSGILRGLGDTRAPMLINVLGFWLIGLPVSLTLAFRLGLGPVGLWWGLVAGLTAVAGLLLLRLTVRLTRPVARVSVD